MRLTRAKLFPKSPLYGQRDYFVLTFRKLLYHSPFVLFLSYYNDSSIKLNELRYLAAHDGVQVKLLLRRWLPSIFLPNHSSWIPFHSNLLVLYSETPQGLLGFLQNPEFQGLLEYFPFTALSCQGLLSQDPLFASLLEPKGLHLLQLLNFIQHTPVGCLRILWSPLGTLLRLFPCDSLLKS